MSLPPSDLAYGVVELPLDLEDLRSTLRNHSVRFALLFGSHADGSAAPDSDVDLAVWSDTAVDDWALRGALPTSVDLLDLTTTSGGLAGRVAMTGLVVLDDDPPRRVRWQAETRKRHLDEAFRRERFRRDFVAAHG